MQKATIGAGLEPKTPDSLPTIQEKSPGSSDVTTAGDSSTTSPPATTATEAPPELPPQYMTEGLLDVPPPQYDELKDSSSAEIPIPVKADFRIPEHLR